MSREVAYRDALYIPTHSTTLCLRCNTQREHSCKFLARHFNMTRKHPSGLASHRAFLLLPYLVILKALDPILDLS